MSYPLRTLIRCIHNNERLGSVVVTRGNPIYDENHTLIGHKDRYLQVRRGEIKGKECHEFFDSLDEWHRSLGIVYPSQERGLQEILIDTFLQLVALVAGLVAMSYCMYFYSLMKV